MIHQQAADKQAREHCRENHQEHLVQSFEINHLYAASIRFFADSVYNN
jgi:hypothetical protein